MPDCCRSPGYDEVLGDSCVAEVDSVLVELEPSELLSAEEDEVESEDESDPDPFAGESGLADDERASLR